MFFSRLSKTCMLSHNKCVLGYLLWSAFHIYFVFDRPFCMNYKEKDTLDAEKVVCKPFMLTGHCGYGDSCIYIHTRDPVALRNKEKRKVAEKTCGRCQRTLREPLKAFCGHVFCLSCAVDQTKEGQVCDVCNTCTYGRFFPQEEV